MKTVDLNKARTSQSAKVFAGRDRGRYWRKVFGLDELDKGAEEVVVVVPSDVLAINISFFLSMFGQSVRNLGKEEFRSHYKFEVNPDLKPLIDLGIDQAVKTSSALPE